MKSWTPADIVFDQQQYDLRMVRQQLHDTQRECRRLEFEERELRDLRGHMVYLQRKLQAYLVVVATRAGIDR